MGLLNCILWDLQTNSLFNFHLPVSMQTTYRYNCKLPPQKTQTVSEEDTKQETEQSSYRHV